MAPILERVADHASNIARAVINLNLEPELKQNVDLLRMGEHAVNMLHAALDAFTSNDAAAAREVIKRDAEINILYNGLFRDLVELMVSEPATATAHPALVFV